MKIDKLAGPIAEYERLAARIAAAVLKRADLAAKLGGGAELVKVIDGFGDADAFAEFADRMPANPPLEDVIKAFGTDVGDIGQLVTTILKGNTDLLVALAEQGCGREPAKLKALSDELKKDPKPMQDMIAEGGLGENPEALAAIFDAGCGQDPGKLQVFLKKFGKKDEREKLAGVLGQGGLGQAPEALGALAREGDGDLLKLLSAKYTSDGDKDALRGLLSQTALDGRAPSNPEMLRNVIVDGLGGKPERLKELHTAFSGGPETGLGDLDRVLTGLDGDDAKGGKRLDRLFKALKGRDGTMSDQALADHLRDPFLKTFAAEGAASRMPPVGGTDGVTAGIAAAQAHGKPGKAGMAGTLAIGIGPAQAADMLSAGIVGEDARATFDEAMLQAGELDARGSALELLAAQGDSTQTPLTKLATEAVHKATTAMNARLEGATPAEIAALVQLAEDAMSAAGIEPDAGERSKAIAAAKAAGAAARLAAQRAAAMKLAATASGGAAVAATEALAAVPPTPASTPPTPLRIAADSYASTAQDAAVFAATLDAARQNAAGSAAANAKVLSAPESTAATKAAQAAAGAATRMAETVKNAPRPVDPALLARAAAVAEAALAQARAVADQGVAETTCDAGKAVTDAIAAAINEAASRIATDRVRGNPEGKKALKNLAVADTCNGIAGRCLKPGSEGGTLAASHGDILAGAQTGKDIAAYELSATQKADAEAEAKAQAGPAAKKIDIDNLVAQYKADAILAQQAANQAAQALALAVPSDDPAIYNGLLKTAADAAAKAFAAARKVVDDGERAKTLTAAKDCAAAIATASTIPSIKVVSVAVSAKADLDVATGAARGAAMTAAAADDLLKATAPDLKQAASDAAYRAAAETAGGTPDATAISDAETAANDKADKARQAADLAVTALAGATPAADSAAYAVLIKDLSDKAEAALVAARDAVDDTKRDAALTAAQNGAQAAAAATKALADHHLAEAASAAKAKMDEDMQDITSHVSANMAAAPVAKVNKTFERGKAALADAAAAVLAQRAEAEPAVRSATELAEEKQAKAALPGADQKAKLDALVAARDAARLLAEKAVEHFAGPPPAQWGGLVAGLPAAAPANAAPMPAHPETQFQNALVAGQAASSATTAARAAAQKVESASKAFERELKAISKPTKAEGDALNAVTPIKTGAEAVTTAIVGSQDFVADALKAVTQSLKQVTMWANANHAAAPETLALQATTGFSSSAYEDAKVAAIGEADLIRVSAGLVKDPYTGPAHPAAVGIPGGTVDMAHITDRHVAETYLFDAESCPKGSQHDAGILLEATLIGQGKTNAQKALIKEGKRNKPNSFFPEDMDAPKAKLLAEEAMLDAVGANIATTMWNQISVPLAAARVTLANAVGGAIPAAAAQVEKEWKKAWQDHTYNNPNPPPKSVTVGVNFHSDPGASAVSAAGVLNARMFYPNDGDKLSTPDVLIIAKALGVNQ
ncbi:hypothetical protein [Microbulbifer sp. S227A]|uniref:hypothetical protein n=1 Tax=Microbulbifer sp. S227A TaxID=3415131 RepID=UPI003C7D162A